LRRKVKVIFSFSNLQKTLLEMASNNWKLYCYGWINIPLGRFN
jgi:hypothetical protein